MRPPTIYCSYIIEGPNGSFSRNRPRPWWRRHCLRHVKAQGDRCWQHDPERYAEGVGLRKLP